MATALAIAALALVAAIGVILIAPVRIALEWDGDAPAPPHWRAQARWLFIAWRFDPSRPGPPAPPPAPRPLRRRKASSGRAGRRFRAALWSRGLVPRLVRLIADLLRLLLPRTVDGWIRVGFDDPASTGMLYGAAHAAAALVPSGAWRLRVEPEFSGPSLTGRGRAEWVLRPGRVLWPVGAFLCSPPAWRAAWAALRARPG